MDVAQILADISAASKDRAAAEDRLLDWMQGLDQAVLLSLTTMASQVYQARLAVRR